MAQPRRRTEVDISGFRQVVKQLSKISGKDFETAMKAEAGHILSAAIRKTPKATTKKVVKRTMPQGWKYGAHTGNRLVTEWKGKKYHVGRPIPGAGKNGGKYAYPATYWMGRTDWNQFIDEQKKKVKERLAIVLPFLSPRIAGKKKDRHIIMESKGFKMSARTKAQNKLMVATAARIKFFTKAIRKEFVKDLKGYMPKNYPLLFK